MTIPSFNAEGIAPAAGRTVASVLDNLAQFVGGYTDAQTATAIAAHLAATDPHGDRAFAATAVASALAGLSPAEAPADTQGSGVAHSGVGQTIGGVVISAGMRVLDTANAVSAGLWVAASGAWSRPVDFASGANGQGKLVEVDDGGVWLCIATGPVVIDTTAQVWIRIDASVVQAGTGLAKVGNVISLALTKALVMATGLAYGDVGADASGAAAAAQAASLQKAANLADVASTDSSRANLSVPTLRHAQCVATTNQALSGALPTIDGYAVQDGDRVLLSAQSTGSQNGMWVAHAAGWVRPNDFPAGGVLTARSCKVTGGSVYKATDWVLTSTSSITIDTTAQTWTQVQPPPSVVLAGSAAPGAGNTGDYFIVRSDGTTQRVSPPVVDAAAWGVSPSATYSANKTAIDNAITAATAMQNVFGTGVAKVRLPAGRIQTAGGHADGGASMVIEGAGEDVTYLQVSASATPGVDVFTLSGIKSQLRALTLDGNRYNIASGDLLALNAAYTGAQDCGFYNAGANAITVGKAAAATQTRLDRLRIRLATTYGIQSVNSGSYDGQWSAIDLGLSGKSGVRLDCRSQKLVNVHSWGNGIEDGVGSGGLGDIDNCGFYLNSSDHQLIGCEGETNNGHGVYSHGPNNSITGGTYWGNAANGIFLAVGNHCTVTGPKVYRNGVANSTGADSTGFAGIQNGTHFATITGTTVWDDAAALSPPTYAAAPTYPYPGRAAIFTQSEAYMEIAGADFGTLVGNTWRQEDTRHGVACTLFGANTLFEGNNTGAQAPPSVASAATITIPPAGWGNLVSITGTTGITAVTAPAYKRVRPVTLVFVTGLTVTSSASLLLAGGVNYTPAAGDTLTLAFDGTNFYEVARSSSRSTAYRRVALGWARFDAQAISSVGLSENNFGSFGASNSGKTLFYFQPTDHAVGSLTTKLKLRLTVVTNDTAPTSTFTASLAPISGNPSGGAASVAVSVGADVAGSTISIVAPAADSTNLVEAADFTPPAAGFYAIKIAISVANMVASSSALVRAELLVRDV